MARHSSHLSLDELLDVINRNLKEDGSFGILLPARRIEEFIGKAQQAGFYLSEKLMVKQTHRHDYFRGVLQFTRIRVSPLQELELVIQDQEGEYSEEFRELLKDYYLKL
jgi:tRNA1Val (adenine37-N6)-methyltransferase